MDDVTTHTPRIYELELDEAGRLILPPELQARLGVQSGETIRIVEAPEGLYFLPARLVVTEVASKISQMMEASGITLEALLKGLSEVGEQLFQERYGHLANTD